MQELKNQVNETLERLATKAQKVFGDKLDIMDYDIVYDMHGTSTFGQVNYGRSYETTKLRLHPTLLSEFRDIYINRTVIHEFAHVVVRSLYKNGYNGAKRVTSHGKEFKNVCRLLGHAGVGTASNDLYKDSKFLKAKRKTRVRFSYVCECDSHEVTKMVHNRIQSGRFYTCRSCKASLVLDTKQAEVA